jgi:DNA-binding winged helix-turn-helix (wHTH) protein
MSDNLFGMLSAQGKGVRVTDQPRAAVDSVVAFGPFRLLTARHLLLEGEKPLKLSSRALEILMVLLERPGALVTREELVSRVWPDTFVEDGNLRVHMAALRRALGDGQAGNRYVATISGRGYRFVAPVSVAEETALAAQPPRLETARSRPVPLTRMIGRTEAIAALAAHLTERRFVTIVGAGGIGKTTLAVAVTDAVASTYKDKVAFVELALLADPTLVPGTVASVLELPTHSENPLTTLIAFLSKREMLLVLDNCEHVIEVVAMLVERVRESAPAPTRPSSPKSAAGSMESPSPSSWPPAGLTPSGCASSPHGSTTGSAS